MESIDSHGVVDSCTGAESVDHFEDHFVQTEYSIKNQCGLLLGNKLSTILSEISNDSPPKFPPPNI